MKLYKIKHLPTGLFYTPVRTRWTANYSKVKTNLHKNGKIYHSKPSLNHFDSYNDQDGVWKRSVKSEWEIVEMEVASEAQ